MILSVVAPAASQASFETGLYEGRYVTSDANQRNQAFDETVKAGAGIARIDLHWRRVAVRPVTNPTDPGDRGYAFAPIDDAVRAAAARGLQVMLTIYDAPSSAEGPGRLPSAPAGTWMPNAAALGDFAKAVATRYSGKFADLPRVRYYEAWNEPNLPQYLNPQFSGQQAVSAELYRQMLSAFYDAVKSVDPSNVVIAGATAPFGDPPQPFPGRVRPLVFDRTWMCVNKRLKRTNCGSTPRFDILSHHPIEISGGPTASAVNRDDVATPDLARVRKLLRGAERAHAIGGRKRHPIWATEIWWESNPPNPDSNTSLAKQARWVAQSFYLIWKAGAKAVIYLSLYDQPPAPLLIQSGLLFENGALKPSFNAFRFPFVTDRKARQKLLAWGKSPRSGKLKIQQLKGGKWKTVKRLKVGRGKVFTANLPIRGKAQLRATVGGEKSVVWRQ